MAKEIPLKPKSQMRSEWEENDGEKMKENRRNKEGWVLKPALYIGRRSTISKSHRLPNGRETSSP